MADQHGHKTYIAACSEGGKPGFQAVYEGRAGECHVYDPAAPDAKGIAVAAAARDLIAATEGPPVG